MTRTQSVAPPLPAERPSGASPPGTSPPDDAFALVLEDQARTATAEGQTPGTPVDSGPAATADQAVVVPDASPLAELLATVGGEVPVAPTAPAATPVPADAAPVPADAAQATATPEAPVLPAAPQDPAAPAVRDADASPEGDGAHHGRPEGGPPGLDHAPGLAKKDLEPGQTPGEAKRLADGKDPKGSPKADTPKADAPMPAPAPAEREGRAAPATTATPATPATPAGGAAAQAAQPAQPATPATPASQPTQNVQPAAPGQPVAPAPAQAPAPPQGVLLADRLERVHALVELAQSGGTATARLELHPLDLGRIDVLLRQSSDGVVATVSAKDPTTLEVLQQSGLELKRSLEDRGVVVARLDLQLGAQSDERRQASEARDGSPSKGSRTAAIGESDGTAETDQTPTTTTTRGIPAGALVDVHA